MSKIFDISPVISERLGVFPGDTAFKRKVALGFSQGDNLALSSIESTVHLGAHTDAPNHYRAGLSGMSERELGLYMGRAQVVHVNVVRGSRVGVEQFRNVVIQAPRVLIATETFPDPEKWNSDFAALSPELVEWLHANGVRLIGIDTPSIDPENSKTLDAHQVVADHDMAILEGIVLTQVPDGIYTLIALPLKIEDSDASPVRAVLLADLNTLKS